MILPSIYFFILLCWSHLPSPEKAVLTKLVYKSMSQVTQIMVIETHSGMPA
uniref:Uncharacterized protein n=1 Tax=Arundo donax TaxID=35708 RepID=A0A0A9HA90_ARUDO